MPSSYTASLRFEKQFTGENVNTWGDRLNTLFDRADFAIAGLEIVALSGDHTLTSSNTVADQARAAVLKFTGGGPFTVTIPAVKKTYRVWNACSAAVTLTTGGGDAVSVDPDDIIDVLCDGANVKANSFGGLSLKDYIASVVVGGGATLPSLVGNSGKWLTNNGDAAVWADGAAVRTGIGAAPTTAPVFMGGVTVGGGVTAAGSTKQNVEAVMGSQIDVSLAEFFTKSISTNTTFTFIGAMAAKAQAFILDLTISLAAVPTWPTEVKWTAGIAPAFANGRHLVGFMTDDGGETWVGVVGASAVS